MGAPIFGTRYVLASTPEGDEHPNVIDRFVKQEHFCDTHCVWTNHHPDCALAQRKPLTDDEIELAYREIWRALSDGFSHTSVEWIEAGIRYAEKVHGIE